MDRATFYLTAGMLLLGLSSADAWCAEATEDDTHTIFGIVMELRAGTPDVPVCLCDAVTGLPLARETYKPIEWSKGQFLGAATQMAIVVTDNKGQFRFENVPDGRYRLVAQKWTGPYKGVFAEHGTVIQLMGTADGVVVPRPTDYDKALVALRPPGSGIVQFDQQVPNNETFMFLSTSPAEFDPILGPDAMGSSFFENLIGVNRMPLGKTTVIGVPNKTLYAFFIAPDNSPGFATVEVPASQDGLVLVGPEPFVAGWSNGRKTPPPNLANLIEVMDANSISPNRLLNLPELSNANFAAYHDRMQELRNELSQTIEIAAGTSARVGDVLAAMGYQRLKGSRTSTTDQPSRLDMDAATAEVSAKYAKADPEVQEFVLQTIGSFGRDGLWLNENVYAGLKPADRQARIEYLVKLFDEAEYGRPLCAALAEASALKDPKLVPGLKKVAAYHVDGEDYDCRPKWMAVAALARQESPDAVPLLISLVDHGNPNTRFWARAALARMAKDDFKADKQAWNKWWTDQGH